MSVQIGAAPKGVYVENPSNPTEETLHSLVEYLKVLLQGLPSTEVHYGEGPPVNPSVGDLWFKPSENRLYTYFA
jgi:hypothetical protein